MNTASKELLLEESYDLDVVVDDGKSYFAGKLNLSPREVTLHIMGEQYEGRDCAIERDTIECLYCRDLNSTFILTGLSSTRSSWRSLCHHPSSIAFFEMHFTVECVILIPHHFRKDKSIFALTVHSKTINNWIGDTQTQEGIVRAYHEAREDLFEGKINLIEFEQEIDSLGKIGVQYGLHSDNSSRDFTSGFTFPPQLFLVFKELKSPSEIKPIYDKLYNLFALITGDELAIERIDVHHSSNLINGTGRLYYPTQTVPPRNPDSCILYPLGTNLRFDLTGTPPLPVHVFSNYFSLPENDLEHWKKYLKYRRMENVEERFMGYFRLLEAFCLKTKDYLDSQILTNLANRLKPYLVKKFGDKKGVDAVIRGMLKFNNSKYNTEKCIGDFIDQIPHDLVASWELTKADLGAICKLRNDIAHANDFNISEADLFLRTKFIETLLLMALLSKIGVTLDLSSKVIHRLRGHYYIVRNEHAVTEHNSSQTRPDPPPTSTEKGDEKMEGSF